MKALLDIIAKVVLNPIVLVAVALISGVTGIVLVLDSPSYAARRDRAERLAPITAAALADAAEGREVLLEGRISPRNAMLYRAFVAYVREEYRDEVLDGDSSQHWVEVKRATPPLLVTLPDGEAQIANDDYTFDSTAATVEEAAATFTKGAVQVRGYVAGSPVLAIGRVGPGGAFVAEFLYAGTRAAYREEMGRLSARSLPIGLAFLLVCAISVVAGVWQLRRTLREIAAEQADEEAAAQQRSLTAGRYARPRSERR